MKYCCDKFATEAGGVQAMAGGGALYPDEMRPEAQFEYADGWHINGCCGGGCYVVNYMLFCPFCGTRLEPAERADG